MSRKSVLPFPLFTIGIDLVYVRRFSHFRCKEDQRLLRKIFSIEEIRYCFSKQNPPQHLAVRFAAKEAVIKALSSSGKASLPLNKIEILSSTGRSPEVRLPSLLSDVCVALSLAHEQDYAIAIALLCTK